MRPISRELRNASRKLARRAPAVVLLHLQAEFTSERSVVRSLIAAIGDGVGQRDFSNEVAEIALRLPAELFAALVSQSTAFAGRVWEQCKGDPVEWIPAVARSIHLIERQERAGLLRRVTPQMTDKALAPLLDPMLEGIASADLSDFALELGKYTAFDIAEFDEPIASAAKNSEAVHNLRMTVLSQFAAPNADRFLLSTLDLTAADIEWLSHKVMDKARAGGLLRRLIDAAPSRSIVSVQRDAVTRDRIFNLLLEDVAASTPQLARLLVIGELLIDRFLALGSAVLPHIPAEARTKFIHDLLARAFMEAETGDKHLPSLLANAGMSLAPRQLVHLAVPAAARTQRVAENVTLLAHAPDAVRRGVASVIDDLSERLIHRDPANFGEGPYRAWAGLITEAGKENPGTQLRAALPTLSRNRRVDQRMTDGFTCCVRHLG